MEPSWTLQELVSEVAMRIAALPAPRNGQIRAIPDDRTVRYYATIGLLDRPAAMRGRTALYGPRHVAQVVAIKRLQAMGRSLSEIQALWPTLDDHTLTRMSGVELPAAEPATGGAAFWKRVPAQRAAAPAEVAGTVPAADLQAPAPARGAAAAIELRVELAPQIVLVLVVVDERIAISPADVHALREAAAPLLAELASRRLASHVRGEEP
jgi:DNA-binding transcriptional MerR regulator